MNYLQNLSSNGSNNRSSSIERESATDKDFNKSRSNLSIKENNKSIEKHYPAVNNREQPQEFQIEQRNSIRPSN